MRALGAVAVIVLSLVLVLFYGIVKHLLCLLYLHPYLGQKGHLERRAVLLYQRADIHTIKLKRIVVIYLKAFLREMEGLLYEISVCIVHLFDRQKWLCYRLLYLFQKVNKNNYLLQCNGLIFCRGKKF